MNPRYFLSLLAFVLIFSACSSPKESTGVWVNEEKRQGKHFNNIFIVVMTADIEARAQLENDLAAVAIAKGYKAVKSMDIMPASYDDLKTPTKEEIVSKVKSSGCDAVLVAALLKKENALTYTPAANGYATVPNYGWNGNYFGYYNNYHQIVSAPGYYSQDKSYVMQSNLYDVVTEEVMWSVQSKIFEPASLKNFSKKYTSTLISQLEKEILLKK